MIGAFKYDDCILLNPVVALIDLSKYFENDTDTELIVKLFGENKGHVDSLEDGCEICLKDDGNMPPVTNEKALQNWAENQLKQFEQ